MRLVVHDYGGYAFPVQLSRALAAAGHQVLHLYAAFLQTPRGSLNRLPSDPATFGVKGLQLSQPFRKHALLKRHFQEKAYGRILAGEVAAFRPDAVISANTPLESQARLLKACRSLHIGFIFWMQDVYGLAVHRLLPRRLPILGSLIGRYYMWLERRLCQKSDSVVVITEDFRPFLESWGVPADRIHAIENWAPLDESPLLPKDNAWSRAHGLADKLCLLYSGTLGMKHNPSLLLRLAGALRDREDVRVVVISEGPAFDWLCNQREEHGLRHLILMRFQPFEVLPQVLASADVLLGILERDAGVFSVPSKVLTYLCAARPLLLAMPSENLAARIVSKAGAGVVVQPDDEDGFVREAIRLLGSAALRGEMALRGRRHAEREFDILAKRAQFEKLFENLRGKASVASIR